MSENRKWPFITNELTKKKRDRLVGKKEKERDHLVGKKRKERDHLVGKKKKKRDHPVGKLVPTKGASEADMSALRYICECVSRRAGDA